MASLKSSFHVRSISLPSTSHPLDASIENQLRRLSAWQAGPSSSSSICQNLVSLKDLYEQMNDLIHLQHNQKALSNELHREMVEEVLNGSLTLLDITSSAMEVLSQVKESILDLQSALRRGSYDEGIHTYLMTRKKISKTVSKCLANLKKAEKNCSSENDVNAVSVLKEAEAISLTLLKSVLSFVAGKKAISQSRGWSLVAKLVKSKNVLCNAENATELEEIDSFLLAHVEKHSRLEVKSFLKQLETSEMVIHELEDGLESVSRCFVKSRVSLLNVINN